MSGFAASKNLFEHMLYYTQKKRKKEKHKNAAIYLPPR